MSKKHFMKLFSVLLCASTLLGSCNSTIQQAADNNASSGGSGAVTPTPVEAKLSNYLSLEYEKGWDDIEDASDNLLNKDYGELIDHSGCLYVFEKWDKDFENNVTETYTVYNAKLDKVVLEKTNTYPDSNYGDYVHEDKCKEDINGRCYCDYLYEKREPVEIHVSVNMEWINNYRYVSYVLVQTDTYTQISEDVIKEESLADGYQRSCKWEVFDSHGQLVTDSLLPIDEPDCGYNDETGLATVLVGDTVALVDVEEDKMVASWGAAETKYSDYDYENDKYYYYLHSYYGYGRVEVYDKAGKLVASYETSMDYYGYDAFVLQSGDVLIQTSVIVEDYFDVETYILDVETNKLNAVEWDYVVNEFMTVKDLDDNTSFTENVVNAAVASKLLGEGETGEEEWVFFDNDLNVQFVFSKLIPGQSSNPEISLLSTGDYLVYLDTPVGDADRAIVTQDGKVRCYVPYNADIVEDRIVVMSAERLSVFNFDLEFIAEFDIEDEYNEYSSQKQFHYQGRLGDRYVFIKSTRNWDYEQEWWEEEWTYEIYMIDISSNYTIYGSEDLISLTESYAIVYDEDEGNNGKYKLYNADWNCLLVTENEMSISEYDGNYVVTTSLEGEDLVYVFASNTYEDKGGNE